MKKKKITKFGDIEIENPKCYQHKIPISIKTTDINVIVISNKVSFSKKNLNVSLSLKMLKNRSFCIFFPKLNAYRRDFRETKHMPF